MRLSQPGGHVVKLFIKCFERSHNGERYDSVNGKQVFTSSLGYIYSFFQEERTGFLCVDIILVSRSSLCCGFCIAGVFNFNGFRYFVVVELLMSCRHVIRKVMFRQ